MTKPRLWERLQLSEWGRVKAMADHLGFKVQRLKADQCRLLMPNVEVNDTLTDIELTDTLTDIEALLREAAEEKLRNSYNGKGKPGSRGLTLAGGKQSALAANTGGGGTMPADSDCCRPAAMSVVGT